MDVVIPIFFFLTIIALSGMLLGYAGLRRNFKLETQKEDRRLIEARTKELEAQNKRVELEYNHALLEIERFDRRLPGADGRPTPSPVTARPAPGATGLAAAPQSAGSSEARP